MNLTLALARARALTRDEPNSNPSPVGRLAGVQIVVNETTYPAYPQSNRRPSGGWFTAIGDAPDFSSLAIHFKDPAKLCSAEAGDDVAGGSIGDRLWIRLGTASAKAADFEQLPLLEEAMQATIQYSDSGSGARAAAFLATSSTLASNVLYPGCPESSGHGTTLLAPLQPYERQLRRRSARVPHVRAGRARRVWHRTLFSMGRVPTVGGVLPSQHPSGPPGLFVAPGDSAWEFPVPPFEPFFLKPGPHPLASAAKWPISRSGTAPPPALPA